MAILFNMMRRCRPPGVNILLLGVQKGHESKEKFLQPIMRGWLSIHYLAVRWQLTLVSLC